jgi:gamma-glutamylcyclotransferase (GGCT)/AIG2-like uncharacterized protein YtfP
MKEESAYLFAYGTLRDSSVNHQAHFLKEQGIYIGPAYIHARLYRVTWYPAVVLDPAQKERVSGDIYELPYASREMILHELDGYEGIYAGNEDSEEYERLLTAAYLEDGSTLQCWVYNYKHSLREEQRIRSGDYLKYLRNRC